VSEFLQHINAYFLLQSSNEYEYKFQLDVGTNVCTLPKISPRHKSVTHYPQFVVGTYVWHITQNYSTVKRYDTLPIFVHGIKCGTLHKIIHRYTSVAHHLQLIHPKAVLIQWPRFKLGTSKIQVQKVTATPVLWATVVQSTSLLVFKFSLASSHRMTLLLMLGPSVSLLSWHSNAQKEVQGNTRTILNSLEHEMNEDYVSRFIYYFAANIMHFLKNTEMKLREIIALLPPSF
jgi:hypothetical protein